MTAPSFGGRTVLAFESRRAEEIRAIIESYGGRPIVAPAMREVPVEPDAEITRLAGAIARGEFEAVIFLTGVGARALLEAAGRAGLRDPLLAALARARIIVRGPKPAAVMRELKLPVWLNVPEPNTWRELISALDTRTGEFALAGARIAVQEYGVPNTDLVEALRRRGAIVTAVQAYRWALPQDTSPLEDAARRLARGEIDVVLVTTGVQIGHFWQIVERLGLQAEVRRGLDAAMIASIGPTASAALRRGGLEPALEPTHPKMGMLVREAAAHFAAGT
jgi:uroporphyrinogen-III synthase